MTASINDSLLSENTSKATSYIFQLIVVTQTSTWKISIINNQHILACIFRPRHSYQNLKKRDDCYTRGKAQIMHPSSFWGAFFSGRPKGRINIVLVECNFHFSGCSSTELGTQLWAILFLLDSSLPLFPSLLLLESENWNLSNKSFWGYEWKQ